MMMCSCECTYNVTQSFMLHLQIHLDIYTGENFIEFLDRCIYINIPEENDERCRNIMRGWMNLSRYNKHISHIPFLPLLYNMSRLTEPAKVIFNQKREKL